MSKCHFWSVRGGGGGRDAAFISALMPVLSSFFAFLLVLCGFHPCGDESFFFVFCSANGSDWLAISTPVKPKSINSPTLSHNISESDGYILQLPLGFPPQHFPHEEPHGLHPSFHGDLCPGASPRHTAGAQDGSAETLAHH